MYVMEYLIYHLRPYGIDSMVHFKQHDLKTHPSTSPKKLIDGTNKVECDSKDEKQCSSNNNSSEKREKLTKDNTNDEEKDKHWKRQVYNNQEIVYSFRIENIDIDKKALQN